MRIGGLASGMDIDQLVKDLMRAERMPLDKLKQKKQTLEWQRDDYRAMNTLLLDFRSLLTQMKLTTQYRARQTASTDETKVTASASSAAGQSSYSISNVTQLASAETLVNGGKVNVSPGTGLYQQTSATGDWRTGAIENKTIKVTEDRADFSLDTTNIKAGEAGNWSIKVGSKVYKAVTNAADLNDNTVLVDDSGNLTFNKNIAKGSEIKVTYIANTRTDTYTIGEKPTAWQLSRGSVENVDSIVLKVDGVADQTFSITGKDAEGKQTILNGSGETVGTLDSNTGRITFTDAFPKNVKDPDNPDAPAKIMTLEFTYDHQFTTFAVDTHTSKGQMHETFLVSGNESLNAVVSKVNASNVGVSMFYDSFTQQMTMTRKETGDFNSGGQQISTSGSLINNVFQFGTATVKEQGKNAVLEINGLQTERTSNTFEMNGVTFTIKNTFTTAVSVSVNNDGEKVFENIKDFVNKYNEMIGKIQGKMNEEYYRSYKPLTDEQREGLSDKQQEIWEEKAKSGLLRRDPLLSGVLSEMRMDFYSPVKNSGVSSLYDQLAKIGIKTTANYLEGGKLEIDEAKLRKAIEEDPESVENFFKGDGSTSSEKGVIHRLYDTATAAMDKLRQKAGNSFSTNKQFMLGLQLDDVNTRIFRFEDRMKMVEDRYWRQFTAMEKAVQRANEQSMYLMQQFNLG